MTCTSLWECSTRFLLLVPLCLVTLLGVSGHHFLTFLSPKTWWREIAVFGFSCVLNVHKVNVTTDCGDRAVHSPSQSFPTFYGSLGCLRPISDIPSFPILLTLALLTQTWLFPEVKQDISGARGTYRNLKCTAFPHLQNQVLAPLHPCEEPTVSFQRMETSPCYHLSGHLANIQSKFCQGRNLAIAAADVVLLNFWIKCHCVLAQQKACCVL